MNTQTTYKLSIALFFVALAVSAYASPQLPEQVASHWNSKGVANDTFSKFWGLYLVPLIMLFMVGLLALIPRIAPLKKNIESFRGTLNIFILAMTGYFLYIHILMIIWNLGREFNMTIALMPALAGLWYVIGVLLGSAKRNYFIGIRTPWTLSSDVVWDKTHALGGKFFKWTAPITLAGMFIPEEFLWVLIPILVVGPLYLVVYSYVIFVSQKNN